MCSHLFPAEEITGEKVSLGTELSPSLKHPNLYLVCSNGTLELRNGPPGRTHRGPLVRGWLLKTRLSRGSQSAAGKGQAQFTSHDTVHIQD